MHNLTKMPVYDDHYVEYSAISCALDTIYPCEAITRRYFGWLNKHPSTSQAKLTPRQQRQPMNNETHVLDNYSIYNSLTHIQLPTASYKTPQFLQPSIVTFLHHVNSKLDSYNLEMTTSSHQSCSSLKTSMNLLKKIMTNLFLSVSFVAWPLLRYAVLCIH